MSENYTFKWKNIGDIDIGRPNLGPKTYVSIYRLMQYTMKDVLSQKLGNEEAGILFKNAGRLAGTEFCKNILNKGLPFEAFLAQLHEKLLELSIGVLKIEKSDKTNLQFTLTISEDLDCSGLPVTGDTVCDYDEGFIEGILHEYSGKVFDVKEVDCWSIGDRTCRFEVKPVN